jgi:hypothetical protein
VIQKFVAIIIKESNILKFGYFHAIIDKNGTKIEIYKSNYKGKAY